jgi:photosystem II stability/assembly factor-like uncharacterized protein
MYEDATGPSPGRAREIAARTVSCAARPMSGLAEARPVARPEDMPRPHALVAAALLAAVVTAQEVPTQVTPQEVPTQDVPGQESAGPATTAPTRLTEPLTWRHLGPANPMGRMTDIDVHPSRPNTWFVGTAGGGLWRTQNRGTTWECVFNTHGTVSIGDVAVSPSDPDIVWIGSGEENARNSVQWGDGVYKSTDGGATWQHMGLRETFQIGHVEIHPTNPDIVYVAALGRLWGENEERGVYRTVDGGRSWERVLFVDDKTGCIDVRLHPTDPNTVFACLYERKRDAFDGNDPAVRFGKRSGLYKSIDGGENWRQLTNGLPSCTWGRSGIDILLSQPDTMFAIIETERSGWQTGERKDRNESDPPEDPPAGQQTGGAAAANRPAGRGTAILGIGTEGDDGAEEAPGAVLTQVTDNGPAQQAGLAIGDRITKVDDEAVKTYADLIEIVRDSRAGQKVVLTYVRGDETLTAEVTYGRRDNAMASAAGRPNGPYSGRLFGQEANKQKYQGEQGHETGGVFRSDDRGETWRRLNSLTERPFYYSVIRVDPRTAENIYCVGTTLWGSFDGGEKFDAINRGIHVDFHGIWIDPTDSEHVVAVSDGGVNETRDRGKTWQVHRGFSTAQYYDAVADNSVPYNVIGGLQDNGTWVVPSRTRYREGILAEDCFTIWGGDGFGAQTDPVEPWIVYATSQNGAMGIVDLRSGQTVRVARDRPEDRSTVRFNWDAPFVLSPHNRLTFFHAGTHVFRGERHSHLDNRASRPEQGPIGDGRGIRMRCLSPRLGNSEEGTATAIAESPRVPGLIYVGTDDGALWRTTDDGRTWSRIDDRLPILARRYVSDLVPSHFVDGRVYLTLDGHRSDDFRTYVFVSEDRGDTWQDLTADLPLREPCYAVMEDPRNAAVLYLGTEYGAHVSLDRGETWQRLGSGLPTVAVRDLFVQDRDSDLVAATHGRGVYTLDIEAVRQLTNEVLAKDAHLFAVEPAYLWRMSSRNLQGHKAFAAANPPYGTTFHVWLREAPKDAPVLTVHDVAGKEITRVTGKARQGLQVIQWDARVERNRLASPGTYRVRLAGHDAESRAFELRADPTPTAAAVPTTPSSNQ